MNHYDSLLGLLRLRLTVLDMYTLINCRKEKHLLLTVLGRSLYVQAKRGHGIMDTFTACLEKSINICINMYRVDEDYYQDGT